jgi:hypothetical protein
MANVIGSVAGGDPDRFEADTVADVREQLGLSGPHTATVDGDTVDDTFELSDNQYVCFAPAVKGGSL